MFFINCVNVHITTTQLSRLSPTFQLKMQTSSWRQYRRVYFYMKALEVTLRRWQYFFVLCCHVCASIVSNSILSKAMKNCHKNIFSFGITGKAIHILISTLLALNVQPIMPHNVTMHAMRISLRLQHMFNVHI